MTRTPTVTHDIEVDDPLGALEARTKRFFACVEIARRLGVAGISEDSEAGDGVMIAMHATGHELVAELCTYFGLNQPKR